MKYLFLLILLTTGAYAQDYRFFANERESLAHAVKANENSLDGVMVFSSFTDEKYVLARSILEKVVKGHVALNPKLKDLPLPSLLLIESPNSHGEVAGKDEDGAYPFQVILSKDIIDHPEQAEGVLAHELSHLYLKHSGDDMRDGSRWTLLGEADCEVPLDKSLMPDLTSWINAFQWIGLGKDPGFDSLPSPKSINPGYPTIMEALLNRAQLIKTPHCEKVLNLALDWSKKADVGFDKLGNTYTFNPVQRSALFEASSKLATQLTECFEGHKKIELKTLFAEGAGVPEDSLEDEDDADLTEREIRESSEDMETYGNEKNMVEGLRAMVRTAYERMGHFENQVDTSKLRFRSDEDEADILAVRVLKQINSTPDGLNSFLTKEASCTSAPYGTLLDTHHSNCWRQARNSKLFSELPEIEKK